MTATPRIPWITCLAAVAIGVAMTVDEFASGAQVPTASAPVVVIDAPAEGSAVVGQMIFVAHVEPASVRVRSIMFMVDGVPQCTAAKEPFECSYDVGPRAVITTVHADGSLTSVPRKIHAIATLTDGRKINGEREGAARGYVDSMEVNAVNVPVVVQSKNGKAVLGLTQDQFEIRDEGQVQKITLFESENPLTHVVVALDHSYSMGKSLEQLKSAASKFMDGFKPPNKVTLVAFNHGFNVLTLPSPDRPETDQPRRRAALQILQAVGGSSLYDAILKCLDLPSDDVALRALVVFSDGDDLNSEVDSSALAQRVRATNSAIYMVIRQSGPRAGIVKDKIESFVKMSGGRWLEVEDQHDIQNAFAWISGVLEKQYLLGFVPEKAATSPRHLTVTVKGQPNLTVLFKTEYGPRGR